MTRTFGPFSCQNQRLTARLFSRHSAKCDGGLLLAFLPGLLASTFLLAFFLLPQNTLQAQAPPVPVAELRGAWVATVANIDWPSKPGLPAELQRLEFDSILDAMRAMGMNAVFVQVRPAGDAMYSTTLAPWSKFLTGVQGQPPVPMYDPLEYMVTAAHARRMEFHAWLNPYRATYDLDTAALSPLHPLRALPPQRLGEWFFRYGRRYYFNPANPLVIKHITDVVSDIVLRYDVDGIHFDDYFYPYPEKNTPDWDDYNDFAVDPRGFTAIEDWRRDNVNRLIESVSMNVRKIKPYVKFGVGSFGVWRNDDADPINGSPTRAGLTSYDHAYADVLKWLQKGWIDYVAPQVYWSIGYPPADYYALVDWWSKHTYGRQLYIGQAAYKINNSPNDPNWTQADQITRQIELNRTFPNVNGSIFYSIRPLLRNPLGVQDSLISVLYRRPALVPGIASLSKVPPATPQICRIAGKPGGVKFAWHICDLMSGEEMPYYFVIYRFNGAGLGDFRDPKNLLNITSFNPEKWIYEDQTALVGEYYTYVIVGYNRMNVESYSSEPVVIRKTDAGISRKAKRFFAKG